VLRSSDPHSDSLLRSPRRAIFFARISTDPGPTLWPDQVLLDIVSTAAKLRYIVAAP